MGIENRILIMGLALGAFAAAGQQGSGRVDVWLTNPDKAPLFARQEPLAFGAGAPAGATIAVDEKQRFQPIDGFGYALTGGSAQHLIRMEASKRAEILRELFTTEGNGIGVSYVRLSIGASDLNDHVFTYDDLPEGATDPEMAKFDLGPDRADVIPVMKEILRLNPKIRILGSPWTPPSWMKTNGKVKGGKLKPECYAAYAKYFVKYIRAMAAEGIRIDAITVQNEPLNPKNTPSLVMEAPEEADFIKNHLGPAFRAAKIKTRIILYDHNCDVPEYATSILADAGAAKYVDGSGFHLYGGKIDAMTKVHDAYPAKNLYFTEQMVTGWVEGPAPAPGRGGRPSTGPVTVDGRPTILLARQVERLIIGATRNWSRNVLLWNLAADPNNDPHTNDGGCGICQGAITIDGNAVTRNLAYYTVAHAAKFVPAGSVRIGSTEVAGLPNVAFRTPQGRKVLVVVNSGQAEQAFAVTFGGKTMPAKLKAGAVATYVW